MQAPSCEDCTPEPEQSALNMSIVAQTELRPVGYSVLTRNQAQRNSPMTPYQKQLAQQAGTEMDSAKLETLVSELSRSLSSERLKLDSIKPFESKFDVLA
jgi:hypothetical protein